MILPQAAPENSLSKQKSYWNVPTYLHQSQTHLFVHTDLKGNLLYANLLFQKTFACLPVSCCFNDLLAAEDKNSFLTALQRSREADGTPCSVTLRFRSQPHGSSPLLWEFSLVNADIPTPVFSGIAALTPNAGASPQITPEWLISSLLNFFPSAILLISEDGLLENLFFPWQEPNHWLNNSIIGKQANQVLPPEMLPLLKSALAAAATDNYPIIGEFSLTWNGQLKHYEARFHKIHSREVVCFLRDITEKKQTRLDLEAYQRQTQNLLEQIPGGLFIIDEHTNGAIEIAFASSRLKKMLGIDASQELSPQDIWYTIPEAYRPNFMALLANARNALKEFIFEFPFVSEQRQLWYRVQETPLHHEKDKLRWYGLLTDITQEKIMRDQLQLQLDILNQVGDAVIATDHEGKITYWNRAAEKLYGYTYEEVKGHLLLETIVNELQHKQAWDIIADLKNGKSWQGEFPVHRKDNTSFIAYAIIRPLFDTNGIKTGIISISSDISQEIQRRTELNNSLAVISRQNQRLLEFTYIVSHNLRSHAANIKGLLELDAMSATEEEHREYIRLLTSSAQNLLATLDHLDELTRIQNHVNPAKEKLRLNDFVCQVLDNLSFKIAETGARIVNEVSSELTILYSPTYLESILLNLLSNAIKYRAADRALEIRIYIQPSAEGYWLCVADNGLGIDLSRYKDRIFKMYQILHDHPEARGLGLFICRNQAEAMGGRIEVSSEHGVGSTFRLLLPRNPEA